MRIDAHQHFWRLERGDYDWPTPDMTALYRTFEPADLQPLAQAAGITHTVAVQAAPNVDETRYLLELAADHALVAGVVGWVPLLDAQAPALLAELAQDQHFKGVRPMLQSLPDGWIAQPALAGAIEALIDLDLSFDALVFTRHLADLWAFARRFPALRLVLDHGAKPPIREGAAGWQAWADGVARCAALPNVWCKLSGLLTEAQAEAQAPPQRQAGTLQPYVRHLLDQFGPERLMWGSDWPVLNLNGSYAGWSAATDELLAGLSGAAREHIFGDTAKAFYKL
jgi:L-fuconolactonase